MLMLVEVSPSEAELVNCVDDRLQHQGELTKPASIIPRPLTWSSVQRLGFSGVSLDNRPLPGGTHGCYYYGRLDQVVLSPSERSARRGTFASFARGHCCDGNLWCHRRLR